MAVISEFTAAVNQICSERGIDPEEVFTALEEAVLTAYQKEFGENEDLKCEIDRESGQVHIIVSREVVKKVEDQVSQISLEEAKGMDPDIKVGDRLEMELPTEGLGRIAAQTAKQVILQKMREAEKSAILDEFSEKIGTVVTGMVQRMMGPIAVVEIGKATAKMPPEEQIPNEFYKIGERYKFLVKEIRDEDEELIVSRKDPQFLIELFKLEVPEIESGIVEIKAVAREAGSRSKLAVISNQEGIDPIGSCVGQRGVRIANVMSELGEEKIDIIEWAEDEAEFVAKALGPAEVNSVKIDKDVAAVQVSDDQLSLAIGKEGQNVRLAAKLTDKKIDIMSPGLKEASQAAPVISSRVLSAIEKAGISLEDMLKMTDEEVLEIKGIGKAALEEIRNYQDLMTKTEEPSTPEATTSQGENSSSETEEESETEEKPVKEDDSREEQVDENLDNKEEDGKEKGTDKVE
jgi:N utilization substance protein A